MLVCLSAAMVMMTNQFIVKIYGDGDPARLGAQVISGIGFLGAGTIIVTRRNQVRGLTTAAGLWSAACLGLAIGIGFYEGAIIGGAMIFLIMTLFHKIDSWVTSNNRHITIYASFLSYLSFDHFVDLCRELNVKVKDIEINKSNESYEDGIFAIVNLESQKRTNHMELIKKLSSLDGLKHIEEM
jgi:putative Mg2+ transporter-C (MgtC) family protein